MVFSSFLPRARRARRAAWFATLLLALPAAPARAGDAPTLAQVYAWTRAHDPALRGAQAAYRAALARVPLARSRLLPQVNAVADVSDNTRNDAGNPLLTAFHMPNHWTYIARDVGLVATQALFHPADAVAVSQAELGARIAYLRWVQQDQALILQCAKDYFDLLGAQDAVELQQRQHEAVLEQLAAAKAQFAAGNGTIVDLRDAQARADLQEAQRIAARNQLEVARATLQTLSGQPLSAVAPLVAQARLPALDGNAAGWAAQARQHNLAVAQARLELELARLQTRHAAASGLPTVEAYARADHLSTSGGGPLFPFGDKVDSASVGVQMRWPLFTGLGVQSQVRESEQLLDQARDALDAAEQGAELGARSAFAAVESGRAQAAALRSAIGSTASALDANRTGYAVGVRVNLDVLNALAQEFQARRDERLARYRVLLGRLQLEQAAGQLDPAHLGAVDALLQP